MEAITCAGAAAEDLYRCSICGAVGDYDFGLFVETPDDPPSGLFEMSKNWARYRYACPDCQTEEEVQVAPPEVQARLRELWWSE